jgi:hypothetical protein
MFPKFGEIHLLFQNYFCKARFSQDQWKLEKETENPSDEAKAKLWTVLTSAAPIQRCCLSSASSSGARALDMCYFRGAG